MNPDTIAEVDELCGKFHHIFEENETNTEVKISVLVSMMGKYASVYEGQKLEQILETVPNAFLTIVSYYKDKT